MDLQSLPHTLTSTQTKGSFPQNYLDLGPDGLGASTPEFALQFGAYEAEGGVEGGGGEGGEGEAEQKSGADEKEAKKQKVYF